VLVEVFIETVWSGRIHQFLVQFFVLNAGDHARGGIELKAIEAVFEGIATAGRGGNARAPRQDGEGLVSGGRHVHGDKDHLAIG
jgi:hypothetical protein